MYYLKVPMSLQTQGVDLSAWEPDQEMDKLPAVAHLWAEYGDLMGSLGKTHEDTIAARELLEAVMGETMNSSAHIEEIQQSVFEKWLNWDKNVEDAAAGDEELAAFYRRVLGLKKEAK